MGRRKDVAPLALVVLALGGCSREDADGPPSACASESEAVHAALRAAPGRVALDGDTLLSSCLTRLGDAGDLQQVGGAWVPVAQELAVQARKDPDGPAATRLGYLIGAARRGAARTQGVHDELIRRLEQELAVVDTASEAFRTGERTGRESG